jgi:carbohydrate kinase (thermoresistant glucokinase family)
VTHRVLVVMGVSAVGKSTIARALAEALGGTFLDADDFHPPQNVAAMAAGRPLDDAMRWPWLAAVAEACAAARLTGPVVVACSALKRRYRGALRDRRGEVTIIYPRAAREAQARRIANRPGQYIPPSLLQSQIDTLEPPGADEGAIRVDAEQDVPAIVAEVMRGL